MAGKAVHCPSCPAVLSVPVLAPVTPVPAPMIVEPQRPVGLDEPMEPIFEPETNRTRRRRSADEDRDDSPAVPFVLPFWARLGIVLGVKLVLVFILVLLKAK
jgi:hypothetical protein